MVFSGLWRKAQDEELQYMICNSEIDRININLAQKKTSFGQVGSDFNRQLTFLFINNSIIILQISLFCIYIYFLNIYRVF